MKFTASQIAKVLNGEVVGHSDVEVHTLSKIEEGFLGAVTFLANPKYTSHIYTTKASIVIVNSDFVAETDLDLTLIKVENAYTAFTTLLEYYNQSKNNKTGIESPVFISESATYGKEVYIGAFSHIGSNVVIGDNVKIYPNTYIGDNVSIQSNTILFSGVKVYHDCVLGANCFVNSGAIIGADGFGFSPDEKGVYKKIPQIGNVILEDFVDIGAATTIDRATLGSTLIKKGVKLDNQIQVAHNVVIGENTVIAAQTGIAGSTKIGADCQIGGQVGIAGHITIGDNVKIVGQSGVTKSIKANQTVNGTPAFNNADFHKSYVHFKNLPAFIKDFNALENSLKNDP
jgi:UDP-3-O-[3-hydroxymyristoyl] glucosamine N-acyltransferase|tara:strand:- start:10014 stop:11042 length:1029 start_codon:yes stop_codon:yes gene_type:complete